jgi:hypothetical protein
MHEQQSSRLVCQALGCGKMIERNSSADMQETSFPRWQNEEGEVFPSAKTLAVKSQILNLRDPKTGDPTAKVIVFTVWRGMVEFGRL